MDSIMAMECTREFNWRFRGESSMDAMLTLLSPHLHLLPQCGPLTTLGDHICASSFVRLCYHGCAVCYPRVREQARVRRCWRTEASKILASSSPKEDFPTNQTPISLLFLAWQGYTMNLNGSNRRYIYIICQRDVAKLMHTVQAYVKNSTIRQSQNVTPNIIWEHLFLVRFKEVVGT